MQIVCSEHIYEGLGFYGCGSVSSVLHPLISLAFLFVRSIERFEVDPIRLLFNVNNVYYLALSLCMQYILADHLCTNIRFIDSVTFNLESSIHSTMRI